MSGLGYVLLPLVRRVRNAGPAGFVLVLVGWMMLIVVSVGIPFREPDYAAYWFAIFGAFPWCLLGKGIFDLGRASQAGRSGLDFSNANSYCRNFAGTSFFLRPQACFGDFSEGYVDCDCIVLPVGTCCWALLIEWVLFLALAIWLDNVVPNESGARRSILYFLQPSFWVGDRDRGGLPKSLATLVDDTPTAGPDEDVLAERAMLQSRLSDLRAGASLRSERNAIECFGLRRVFGSGAKRFQAVSGSWFGVRRGELFCLLGPNGAGKSTTINLLTGLLEATSGDAVVRGEPLGLSGGLDRVRAMMGVCPQFDHLWGRLTAREHLLLYATVKGLGRAEAEADAADLLCRVGLTDAADRPVEGFSGGMKRRLSLSAALIGDPKIVYLDEPTTGMDPISRRQVWDVIESVKPGRAIILTTHSMEEADVLADRVAIMARGALRCLGTSLRLKTAYGAGYVVSLSITEGGRPLVESIFRDALDVAPSVARGSSLVTFAVPRAKTEALADTIDQLESRGKELGLSDLRLSMTSLEEVFLAVATAAEIQTAAEASARSATRGGKAMAALPSAAAIEKARKLGKTIDTPGHALFRRDNGTNVLVPLGAPSVEIDGVVLRVEWGLDEDGSVVVLELAE